MLPDFSVPESKRHLQWRHKGAERAKEEADEDTPAIQFDFSDLLSDLKRDLQAQKDTEERLVAEIRRELENAACTVGDKNFTRSFDQSVARLQSYAECVEIDARQLASSLKSVAGLADNISGRVSALDVAKSRVVECLQRVGDLRDLRTCAEGVEAAMKTEEYDEAARNIHRFLTLDTAVFKMGEQIDAKDGGQSLKHSYEVLRQAATSLKDIIERKFDEAVDADDVASMERYFKLFPLINEHASGLQRFGKYLCSKIEKMGDDNFKIMQAGGTDDKRRNVLYADTLTLLFEGIVRLIQLHQPLIDSFYGPDKLLNLIEILQAECDKQALRVINEFIQKRQFEVKTKQVDGYVRGFERAGKLDAIELDVLLSEVTLMHTRAELYWRFLKRRVGEAPARPLSESHDDSPDGRLSPKHLEEDVFVEEMTEEERKAAEEKVKTQRKERNKKLDTLLNRSALGTKMQDILGKYVLMEQYYMTESVKKALEMDEVEDGTLTSSMLDDVFFIVRKCIRRSITSSSVDCVCAMLNNGVTLLETEFIKQLNGPIKAGYPSVSWTAEAYQTAQSAYQTAQTMLTQHGKSASEAGPERQRSAFLLALNNLRSSVECIQTLKSGLNDDFQRHLNQINTVDKGKLEHSISQFDDLCKRIEHLSAHGIVKLCEAAFKPKLKTSAEAYLDISHNLSEDELTDFESVDPFIENFIAQLDKHIAHFESLLVPANYQDLLGAVCSETANQLERVMYKCVFNRLGGLQLDKELRQLTNYLTSIAGWSMREKCARLSQIVSLLNSETIDEAVEFYHQINSDTSVSSSLTPNELKKTLYLRSDFPREKVKSVKL